jgi:hypothetical protein
MSPLICLWNLHLIILYVCYKKPVKTRVSGVKRSNFAKKSKTQLNGVIFGTLMHGGMSHPFYIGFFQWVVFFMVSSLVFYIWFGFSLHFNYIFKLVSFSSISFNNLLFFSNRRTITYLSLPFHSPSTHSTYAHVWIP